MKWSLDQLLKLKMPYEFSFTLDLKEELIGFEDILNCDVCNVRGLINRLDNDVYSFEMNVKIHLILQCAVSLKEVPYDMDFDTVEVFDRNASIESEYNPIEKNTIDLKEAIITDIIVNKPMRVVLEEYQDVFPSSEAFTEEKEDINPAFADLGDLLKK